MQIQVLFFGGLREALGSAAVDLHVDQEGDEQALTLAELERRLDELYPRFGSLRASVRIAVNETFVEAVADVRLHDGDVVAYIPPVTGG